MWKKIGLIYEDYGQTPVAIKVSDEIFKVFFSSRDDNVSKISSFDLNLKSPFTDKDVKSGILNNGKVGTFDHFGVMPSSVVRVSDKKLYLYYTGWSRRCDVPYHNSIGLAISIDNGETFKRYSDAPLISTCLKEPYFVGTPYVIIDEGIWKCWYYSCVGWENINEKMEPRYLIKYAESKDGITWDLSEKICIDFKSDDEGGICQPSVIKDGSTYKMWYSYRAKTNYKISKESSYKIGYAESPDGISWVRMDQLSGIKTSKEGWDSEMICYSNIIDANTKYMLYNGNNFGATGIGLAEYL